MSWYSAAASDTPSGKAKATDMYRWGLLHALICNRLGICPEDNIDTFVEVSRLMQELTDKRGHPPTTKEFAETWFNVHPEWKHLAPPWGMSLPEGKGVMVGRERLPWSHPKLVASSGYLFAIPCGSKDSGKFLRV